MYFLFSQSYFVALLVNIVFMNGKYYVDVVKHQSFQPSTFYNVNVAYGIIHNQKTNVFQKLFLLHIIHLKKCKLLCFHGQSNFQIEAQVRLKTCEVSIS